MHVLRSSSVQTVRSGMYRVPTLQKRDRRQDHNIHFLKKSSQFDIFSHTRMRGIRLISCFLSYPFLSLVALTMFSTLALLLANRAGPQQGRDCVCVCFITIHITLDTHTHHIYKHVCLYTYILYICPIHLFIYIYTFIYFI
jgi:hypothetical protein